MSPTNWGRVDKLLKDDSGHLRPRWEEEIEKNLFERRRPRASVAHAYGGKVGWGWLQEAVVRNVTTYVDNHLRCLVRKARR